MLRTAVTDPALSSSRTTDTVLFPTTLSTVMVLAMVVFAAIFFFVVDEILAILVRQFLGFGA